MKVVKVKEKKSGKVVFHMEDGSKVKAVYPGSTYQSIVGNCEFTEEAAAQLPGVTAWNAKLPCEGAGEPVGIYKDGKWVTVSFGSEEFKNFLKEYEPSPEDAYKRTRMVYSDLYWGGVERFVGDESNPKYVTVEDVKFGFIVFDFEDIPVRVVYQGYAYSYIKEHCRLLDGSRRWLKKLEADFVHKISDPALEDGLLEKLKESNVIMDVDVSVHTAYIYDEEYGDSERYELYYATFKITDDVDDITVSFMGKAYNFIMENFEFSPEASEKLSEIKELGEILFQGDETKGVSLSSDGRVAFHTENGVCAVVSYGGKVYKDIVDQFIKTRYCSSDIRNKFDKLELAEFVRSGYRLNELSGVSMESSYLTFTFQCDKKFTTEINSLTYHYIMGNLEATGERNTVMVFVMLQSCVGVRARLIACGGFEDINLSLDSLFNIKKFASEWEKSLDSALEQERLANGLAQKYLEIGDFPKVLAEILEG